MLSTGGHASGEAKAGVSLLVRCAELGRERGHPTALRALGSVIGDIAKRLAQRDALCDDVTHVVVTG
jgi:hypothetical protein